MKPTLNLIPSALPLWLFLFVAMTGKLAAAFDSGSTGANGQFPPVAIPAGTDAMVLDLRDGTLTFRPGGETASIPNTPAGGFADGTLNVTSLSIPAGVTLSFISHASNAPICIFAQSTITIDGVWDVSGQDGQTGGVGGSTGGGKGGPGGFKGGNGELTEVGRSGAGHGPGYGAGGGDAGFNGGDGGSFATLGQRATDGPRGNLYGAPTLLPIIGGSGGGGGRADAAGFVAGGGGGAVKLVATNRVTINGVIEATGGNGGNFGAGGGSGGAVRVLSDEVSGSGTINTAGGIGGLVRPGFVVPGGTGGLGRIRLERTTDTFAGTLVGLSSAGAPGVVVLPNRPKIQFTSVAGQPVALNPGGVFGAVDIVIDQPGTITIELAAMRVPVGTTVAVGAKPENVGEVLVPVNSSALAGTFENSTASVDLTFPQPGLYFLEARVNFTLP